MSFGFDPSGPLHARGYVDSTGRRWVYDATALDLDGHACFRRIPSESDPEPLNVRGPNLTTEDELAAWAARIEAVVLDAYERTR